MRPEDQEIRAELQRLAFGRADSPAENARADHARRQLQHLEQAETIDAGAEKATDPMDSVAATDATATTATDAEFNAPDEPDPPRRLLRTAPRWLIPAAAVGLLVIGAIGGAAASGLNGQDPMIGSPTTTPTPTPTSTPTTSPFMVIHNMTGDLAAAERWFASEQTAADRIPEPITLNPYGSIDPATTRLVMQSPGEYPWNLWVAKISEGGFCLYVEYPNEGTTETNCTTRELFVENGLGLWVGSGAGANWDGQQIYISQSK